jgi:hypothetical protein
MTTPTKRDLLSLSDRAFRIAFFYLMPALFVGGFAFLGWRQCSRAVPPEPASASAPEPQHECRYPTGVDSRGGVSVSCPTSYTTCVVCSAGRCSRFDPNRCPELGP